MPTEHLVIGAGGHAKVVLDCLQHLGITARVVDDNPARAGQSILGVVIEHGLKTGAFKAHLAIGDNAVRAQKLAADKDQTWFSVIHPHATVAASAQVAAGCFVAARAVVGPEAVIGTATLINHGAVVDHDCHVAQACHIAPNATLGGGVRLEAGVLLGSGAVVLPGLTIGRGAVVGAGAVVVRNVSAGHVVTGVPAQVKR